MTTELKQDKQESAPKRKIIQISTATTNTGRIHVVALCSDGTLWRRDILSAESQWEQIGGM